MDYIFIYYVSPYKCEPDYTTHDCSSVTYMYLLYICVTFGV